MAGFPPFPVQVYQSDTDCYFTTLFFRTPPRESEVLDELSTFFFTPADIKLSLTHFASLPSDSPNDPLLDLTQKAFFHFPPRSTVEVQFLFLSTTFRYVLPGELTLFSVRRFLASRHFHCSVDDLHLSCDGIRLDDTLLLRILVLDYGRSEVTVELSSALISFPFIYDTHKFAINMFLDPNDSAQIAMERWSKILKVDRHRVKICERKRPLFETDILGYRQRLHVRIVSISVYFLNDSTRETILYDFASSNPSLEEGLNIVRENFHYNVNSIRLTFHKHEIESAQNLCHLETTENDPILVSQLREYQFIDRTLEIRFPYCFASRDDVLSVRRKLTGLLQKNSRAN
jgi:hypothetical protein